MKSSYYQCSELEGVNMPRFWDLFFARLHVRKGWIDAGFVRLGRILGWEKMLVGGLTCENAEVFRGSVTKYFAGR